MTIDMRSSILAHACRVGQCGLHLITARRVAASMGLAPSHVGYYFKTNAMLLDAAADWAVEQRITFVMARLILEKHPSVMKLTGADREGIMIAAARY